MKRVSLIWIRRVNITWIRRVMMNRIGWVNINGLYTVTNRIKQNTLFKTTIVHAKTSKKFIGYVLNNKIKLIDSSNIGVLCVANGFIKNNEKCEIHVKTKTHIAFLVLFILWFIAMSILITWDYLKNNNFGSEFYYSLLLLGLGASLFRLMIYMLYIRAKYKVLNNLKQVLDIKMKQ